MPRISVPDLLPPAGMRLPAQHVEDASSAAEFYANKVLMEWRAKDPNHATWVAALKELLQALKASVGCWGWWGSVSYGGCQICVAASGAVAATCGF